MTRGLRSSELLGEPLDDPNAKLIEVVSVVMRHAFEGAEEDANGEVTSISCHIDASGPTALSRPSWNVWSRQMASLEPVLMSRGCTGISVSCRNASRGRFQPEIGRKGGEVGK